MALRIGAAGGDPQPILDELSPRPGSLRVESVLGAGRSLLAPLTWTSDGRRLIVAYERRLLEVDVDTRACRVVGDLEHRYADRPPTFEALAAGLTSDHVLARIREDLGVSAGPAQGRNYRLVTIELPTGKHGPPIAASAFGWTGAWAVATRLFFTGVPGLAGVVFSDGSLRAHELGSNGRVQKRAATWIVPRDLAWPYLAVDQVGASAARVVEGELLLFRPPVKTSVARVPLVEREPRWMVEQVVGRTVRWRGTHAVLHGGAGEVLAEARIPPETFAVVPAPTGRLLACLAPRATSLVDLRTGKSHRPKGLPAAAIRAAWSPSGREVALISVGGGIVVARPPES